MKMTTPLSESKTQNWRLRRMCAMAMLCALAFLAVAFIRIPVVSFLKYEPKDVLLVIGGFLFGPLYGGLMCVVVSLVEMVTISDTGFIGFIMNMLSSGLFVCVAAGFYHHRRTLKNALWGLIAGVLAMKPEVLILDEPTAGLDPKGRDEILQQIKKLQTETGLTILLVSHSMEDVAEYVDRIIVMNKGSVMYDDTPREVFKHYKELEEVGLAAPHVTYIMHDMQARGADVDVNATTIEKAADEIARDWKSKNT